MKRFFESPDRVIKTDSNKAEFNKVEFNHRAAMNELESKARDIFRRLDKRVEVLEAIEASVDAKMAAFERLLQMADSMHCTTGSVNRRAEVTALFDRGLQLDEIASVLGMQRGEVELILNLNQ